MIILHILRSPSLIILGHIQGLCAALVPLTQVHLLEGLRRLLVLV